MCGYYDVGGTVVNPRAEIYVKDLTVTYTPPERAFLAE